MLEAYATLGYLAAVTERVLLHTLVTGVVYREPGFLAKVISTLDVLSGGRAGLGIGAARFEEEAEGFGFAFPPLGERFERLEETLQICLQMWGEDEGAFEGRHYRLGRTLNSPAALSRPRPFVLVGGGGERKTLRLVAQYANACNIFGGGDQARHKLNVLRSHCETVGRDYDEIEKTTMISIDASTSQSELLDALRASHDLGFTTSYVFARNPEPLTAVELLAGVAGEIGGW
jgi:F420-dependent oxidoreductase-like protein